MAARVVVAFTLAVAVACVAWLCWLKAPGLESKRAGHDATDQAVLFDGRAGSEANLESQAASLPAGPPAAGIGDRQAATSTSLVLEGVVLDAVDGPDGGTVPASNTAVYATDGRPFTQDRTTTRTRADGRFRFELQDSGQRPISFRVFTEASDRLREGYASVTLRQVDHAASAITLTRYRRGDLVGVTVDPKGDELAGVMLEFEFGGPPQRIDSDDHGHFRLPNRDSFTCVTATKPGYVLLHADLPVALDTGGTRPLRIVLAQTARLTVRVCDKDKSPLIHYKVRADISPDETYGPVSFSRGMRPLPVSTAAPDGLASFDSVWSGQKLVLTLSTSDTASASIEWIAERELDGDLLFRKDIEGSPIVLDPGVSRELRAVLADSLKLRGRVVVEAGTAAARTAVHLVAANKGSATEAMSLTTRSDENGTFVFEVPSDAAQLVELRAGENSVFGQPVPVGSRIARITIDVSRPPADEIVLVLQPGLSILGRMTGRDGEAVAGQIIVYPHGKDRRSSGVGYALVLKDGGFAIHGLSTGFYDLLAQPRLELADQWVESIEAGRKDVEIRLTQPRSTRVAFEVQARASEAEQVIVLWGRLRPWGSEPDSVPTLPLTSYHSSFQGWPAQMTGGWSGSGTFAHELGRVRCSLVPLDSNLKDILLEPGLYWFGAKGKTRSGHMLFPIGTGLVRVQAGEYRVRFDLVEAVPVKGRLLEPSTLDLVVGIARSDGTLMELSPGDGPMVRWRPIGADGAFAFSLVPVGKHELWVGLPQDFEASTPAHRQALVVEREGVAPFEVRMGR